MNNQYKKSIRAGKKLSKLEKMYNTKAYNVAPGQLVWSPEGLLVSTGSPPKDESSLNRVANMVIDSLRNDPLVDYLEAKFNADLMREKELDLMYGKKMV